MPADLSSERSSCSSQSRKSSYYHEPAVDEVAVNDGPLRTVLEETVRNQRLRASELAEKYQETHESFASKYMSTRTNAQAMMSKLQSEQIELERAGIISVAALTGLIIGYKRSFFRKSGYSLLLGGTAAAICYPKVFMSYASTAYDKVKEPVTELYTQYGPGSDYKPVTTAVLTNPEYYATASSVLPDRPEGK